MIDHPITGPEKNPATPGSPPRSNLWPEVKRLALLGLAGSIVTGLGTAAYYFRDKIGDFSKNSFRSRIITTIEQELNKSDSSIKIKLLKEILADKTFLKMFWKLDLSKNLTKMTLS